MARMDGIMRARGGSIRAGWGAALLGLASLGALKADPGRAVRPADELFWTPTLEQGIAMATANEVPIFLMGYSLVGDNSTYTKFGEDCASAVF